MIVHYNSGDDSCTWGGGIVRTTQRTALREAGFAEAQTNALAMAPEPLATKEDLRNMVEVLRNDLRWIKWVGGAIGVAVLAELVGGLFA